jgi:ribosome-associated heat shock protein Hsp15
LAGVETLHTGQVRLDKWLWAARFYKTRSLATKAVAAGHVHVNGHRVKPSHVVRVGDQITVAKEQVRWTVGVLELGARRGGASDAALLYEETQESRTARARQSDERRAVHAANPGTAPRSGGRPSKRDRRRLERFRHE